MGEDVPTLRTLGPAAPVAPLSPLGPCGPVAPVFPFGPCNPVAPVSPFGPCGPVAPVAPLEPVAPFIDPIYAHLAVEAAPPKVHLYVAPVLLFKYISFIKASIIPVELNIEAVVDVPVIEIGRAHV